MKTFKIRRINKVNVITIGDVKIQLTDREISKLSMKLESFMEVQASKDEESFGQSDRNFWAKMAQE